MAAEYRRHPDNERHETDSTPEAENISRSPELSNLKHPPRGLCESGSPDPQRREVADMRHDDTTPDDTHECGEREQVRGILGLLLSLPVSALARLQAAARWL